MRMLARELGLAFVLLCSLSPAHGSVQSSSKIVLLIPGFFNFPGNDSAIGLQYFSPTIIKTIRERGYTPVIFDNLDPVGSIAANGKRVLANLKSLSGKHPGAEFKAIAHSAGGLYLAHALTMEPGLPVKAVATISTPYRGAELIDLLQQFPGFTAITSALNLSSLQEFESTKMDKVWASLKIPREIRWITIASEQPTCGLLSCAKAQHQSWLLSLAWRFAGSPGDGVVSVASSHGATDAEAWADFIIPLEHWEVVLDAKLFAALGVTNTRWIDDQQRAAFTRILEKLN